MTIEIQVSNRQRAKSINGAWIKKTAKKILSNLCDNLRKRPIKRFPSKFIDDFETRGQVSLSLVSEAEIQSLNSQWRGKDKATDVLSFPIDLSPPESFLPWQLGEVVICTKVAARQACEFGHSLERELAFLMAHGFLHLLEFDHMTKAEEKEMFSRQKAILEASGFPRSR